MRILAKTIAAISLLGIAIAPMTPVLAAEEKVDDSDLQTAYAMSILCLGATASMAMDAQDSGDTAAYDRLAGEGEIWMGVAEKFGSDLGKNTDSDYALLVSQLIAEESLLGADVAHDRQNELYEKCKPFLDGDKK